MHRLLVVFVIFFAHATAFAQYDVNGNFAVSGNLGVGVDNPGQRVHMYQSSTASTRFRLQNGEGNADFFANDGGGGFVIGSTVRMVLDQFGRMGLGTTLPAKNLHVRQGGGGSVGVRLENAEGYADMITDGGGLIALIAGNPEFNITNSGNFGLGITTPNSKLEVNGDAIIYGEGTVDVLNITGGSDLAEQFKIKGQASVTEVKPGMVVCIDPYHPGELVVSNSAYSSTVAGIVSGAGELKTGMMMGQRESIADGEYPVALTGRVYCFADATSGAIVPGDLLTTSDMPGHAMKVSNFEFAHGSILGKAMSSLNEGQGLILVLVALQ